LEKPHRQVNRRPEANTNAEVGQREDQPSPLTDLAKQTPRFLESIRARSASPRASAM